MTETLLGLTGLFLLMVVQVIIPPIPAEAIVMWATHHYGLYPTTVAAGLGLLVGSVLAYTFGRYLKHRFARFFNKRKVRIVLEHIHRHQVLILWLRILPYNPSDTISYAAGIASVPAGMFLAITSVTSLVRCLMLAMLGQGITKVSTVMHVGSILLLSALVVHVILFAPRKNRANGPPPGEDQPPQASR
ncbi:MAG: VTT domain-containing protein [Kiritimatiellae bacterium]|nr:VTT domain-containing protein [Kiritimatiellia bacterium]